MNKKFVLAVACAFLMMAGCGGSLFGDGEEGSACVDLQFDFISFLDCNEGLDCDTSLNPLDTICSELSPAEIEQALLDMQIPQKIVDKIIDKLDSVWARLCDLLSMIQTNRIGVCVDPAA